MLSRTRIALYAITAMSVALFVFLRHIQPLSGTLIDRLIEASLQTGTPFKIPNPSGNYSIKDDFAGAYRQLFESRPVHDLSGTLQHLEPLLRCPCSPDPSTDHIRLSHVVHHNISLRTLNQPLDAEARHFNPAIIPLPSYAASFTTARYLLVSRLVTPGLHQESLACLASFCLPGPSSNQTSASSNSTSNESQSKQSHHLPSDTVPCTPNDLTALDASGGLRCITPPRRINIPPTPAKRCTGEWASFPNIPGFHDPRVMWSNLGEPLIVVNSASTYGCVGLWVMDLRMLLPELQAVMERRAPVESGNGIIHRKIGKRGEGQQTTQEVGKVKYSQPVVRYRTLTELTRWEGRAEAEKNWILWFPGQDGEAWVSYELFGKWERKEQEDGQARGNASQTRTGAHSQSLPTSQGLEPLLPSGPAFNFSNLSLPLGAAKSSGIEARVSQATSLGSVLDSTVHDSAHHSFSGMHDTINTINTPDAADSPVSRTISQTSPAADNNNASLVPNQPAKRHPSRPSSLATPSPSAPAPSTPSNTPHSLLNQTHTLIHGRHFAQLSSHGFTTPNLTSAAEPPCLFPFDSLDLLGREGHWHQSTPALRLRLCYRSAGAGAASATAAGPAEEKTKVKICTGDKVGEGEEVFFTVVHRKFSHEKLGMPLRYERFVVVWEGRGPWRVLGVGMGPVVFGGEVVRGFESVDVEDEDERGPEVKSGGDETLHRDQEVMRKVGFTYTTSIAWAWRPIGDEGVGQEGHASSEDAEHLSRLGAGYLGEDVMMGIGLDDLAQVVVRVKVEELLGCLRLCTSIEEGHDRMS